MSTRLLDFIRKPFQLQMRKGGSYRRQAQSQQQVRNQDSSSVWALQMKETEAGRVMNFKVVLRNETKP